MVKNKIHNYDEKLENDEIEYWEEEGEDSNQSYNECQFTMCFYCNEEIVVDYLPYHQCDGEYTICNDTSSIIDYENTYMCRNNEGCNIIDSIKLDNEFNNLEEYYYYCLNNVNSNLDIHVNTNSDTNNIDTNNIDNLNYNTIVTTNYDNLDNPDRHIINYSIPIHEIPDILRDMTGLTGNNFHRGYHSSLDQDIIYIDNYQRWCNIIILDMSEECNVCLNKKHKFHQFKACNHNICEDCCFKWFSKNNTCPICRADITKLQNVIPILTSGNKKICV